jgi:hypothetical protein
MPVNGLSKAIANAAPSVIYMFGDSDRIQFASKGMLGANLTNFAGIARLGELTGKTTSLNFRSTPSAAHRAAGKVARGRCRTSDLVMPRKLE